MPTEAPASFLKGPCFTKKMWFQSELAGLLVQGHRVSCSWNLKLSFLNIGPILTAQLQLVTITSLVNNIFIGGMSLSSLTRIVLRQRSAQ